MNRIAASLLACCLLMPLISRAQSSATPALNGACPAPPHGGVAWFDTCTYLPVGNGVKPPGALETPDPQYSETARQAKMNGTVILAVAINAAGTVDAVKVVQSAEPSLDANAVDAVKRWRFTPATKDGKPVPVQLSVETNFRLR